MNKVCETEYLRFELFEQKPKTQVWDVYSKRHGDLLGVVKWDGPWRQYCFFPKSETIWSRSCLEDVNKFMSELMKERKQKQAKIDVN